MLVIVNDFTASQFTAPVKREINHSVTKKIDANKIRAQLANVFFWFVKLPLVFTYFIILEKYMLRKSII